MEKSLMQGMFILTIKSERHETNNYNNRNFMWSFDNK